MKSKPSGKAPQSKKLNSTTSTKSNAAKSKGATKGTLETAVVKTQAKSAVKSELKSAEKSPETKTNSVALKASVKAPLKTTAVQTTARTSAPMKTQAMVKSPSSHVSSTARKGAPAYKTVAPKAQSASVPVVAAPIVDPTAFVHPDAALLAPKTPARSNRGYRPGAVEATKTLAELSDEPIEFKVGDNAVYPGHGVGRVNAIETKEIAGTKLTFYSIQILDSGMKIMVPQANVKNVGLRPIISKEEATLVVSILKQTDVKIDNQTWNRRYREYMEKIKTGGVREIAEVLRDLFLLKVDKELSFGERKMLDTARNLLIKELILATGRDELMKEAEVKAILDLT